MWINVDRVAAAAERTHRFEFAVWGAACGKARHWGLKMTWTRTSDGSIEDHNGKVIFFSTQRFVQDVCDGNCCFICGAKPDAKAFNDEHVLPEWVLRRFNLFNQTITLPNGTQHRYDQYAVKCCSDCNSLMGKEIEQPISEIVNAGPDAVQKFVATNGPLKVFVWMGLIFLKAHLKDKFLRVNRDLRQPDSRIADVYEWERLHHIHCVVRCFYNDVKISRDVFGSFLALAAKSEPGEEEFDFGDLYEPQTLFIRLGEVGLFAVFNDSCGVMNGLMPRLRRIEGPLSALQLREVMTDLAFVNLHIKERPKFRSEWDRSAESIEIKAEIPTLFELSELDYGVRGALMRQALGHAMSSLTFLKLPPEQAGPALDEGRLTLLFDDQGKFIKESFKPLPSGGKVST
jgi:hypothetical protein